MDPPNGIDGLELRFRDLRPEGQLLAIYRAIYATREELGAQIAALQVGQLTDEQREELKTALLAAKEQSDANQARLRAAITPSP